MITRLLDEDRNQISDPTGISGTIYAVLDVQSNDETWTDIGLTLNGETVTPMCRGTGGSSADVSVGPGLAAAGQVEVECRLQTNAVEGACVGMPLMPKYANGAYELGAFLTTDTDDRRDVVATQPIALNNHGFVKIAHVPGNRSEVGTHTAGLTFYGGPSTVEGNVNTFHACPVAYDGTAVGTMQLGTVVTDTERPDPNPIADADKVTFRNPAGGPFYPVMEAPFTWTISTAHSRTENNHVENVPGETEHWIINDGIITDPNGRDVTATFREGGEMAKYGPLHFDFKAPAIASTSEVVIVTSNDPADWESTDEIFYRDGSGGSTRRFRITDMSDMGVGHVYGTTSAIAVGDYSAGRNSDGSPSTAFTAIEGLENVTLVNQLPEEDATVDGVADGGGVDTYVAEVQSLADRLGNSTWLGGGRIRTDTHFGVDRTAPEISRPRPSEALVLSGNSLFFEVEEQRLATGEDGSGLAGTVYAWAGSSNPRSSSVYWGRNLTEESMVAANGSVEVDITPPSATHRFARETSHTVYVWTADEAGNGVSTTFTFTRDQTDPALSLSAVPSSFAAEVRAKSVSVTVAGTLSDATEIRRSFLSIHHGTTCTAADPLESSQVSGPVRRLDNESNTIEFSEVFTIKPGNDAGMTDYCFFLSAEDDARDADDRASANMFAEAIATFNVNWPAGPPPPEPGPTFEFFTPPAAGSEALVAADSLRVGEGATADNVYWVKLKDAPSDATYPLEMTVEPSSRTVTTVLAAGAASDGMFGSATDSVSVTVTANHDLNIDSELRAMTHMAKDFDDTPFAVRVLDDDLMISANKSSVRENDEAAEVTLTVEAGLGADISSAVTVTLGPRAGTTTATTDFVAGSWDVTIPAADRMKDTVVMVDAVDDAVQNEVNEAIQVAGPNSEPTTGAAYVAPRLHHDPRRRSGHRAVAEHGRGERGCGHRDGDDHGDGQE